MCCAKAAELAAAHPTASQRSIPVDSSICSVFASTGSWDVEAIFSMRGEEGEVPDIVLEQLEAVVHTLTFEQTLEVYVQLSKVRFV